MNHFPASHDWLNGTMYWQRLQPPTSQLVLRDANPPLSQKSRDVHEVSSHAAWKRPTSLQPHAKEVGRELGRASTPPFGNSSPLCGPDKDSLPQSEEGNALPTTEQGAFRSMQMVSRRKWYFRYVWRQLSLSLAWV